MSILTERLSVIVDARTGGAIKEFDKLSQKASKTGGDTGALAGAFGRLGFSAQTAGTLANGALAAAAIGVGALVGTVSKGISQFLDLAATIRGLQRVTGQTAEDASKLNAVLGRYGVSTDDAAKGFFRLQRAVASGGLAKFGVEVARNADGTSNFTGTLKNVSTAYKGTADAAQRAALVQAAFGRGGQALIPILSATQSQLDAIGRTADSRGKILSAEDLERARHLSFSLKDVKDSIGSLPGAIGKALVSIFPQGQLDNFAIGLRTVNNLLHGQGFDQARINGARDFFDTLHADKAKETAKALGDVAENADKLQGALTGAAAAQRAYRAGQDKVAEGQKTIVEKTAELNNLLRQNKVDVDAVAKANLDLRSATLGVADAQAGLRDARKELNDLLKQAKVDTKAVADAELNLRQATLSATEAHLRLGDAQDAVTKAQEALNSLLSGPSAKDAEKAALSIAEAQQQLADAKQAEVEATRALNVARAVGGGDERAKAALDLSRAQLAVRQATDALSDAQSNQNDLLNAGKAGSEKLTDAQDALETAQNNLEQAKIDDATATRNLTSATTDLATAQRGDLDLSNKIEDAKRRVADQQLAVDRAVAGETKARSDLAVAQAGDLTLSKKIEDARKDLKKAQDDLNQAVVNQGTLALDAAGKVQAFDDAIAEGGPAVQALRDQLNALVREYPEVQRVLDDLNRLTLATAPVAGGAATYGGGSTPGPVYVPPGTGGGGTGRLFPAAFRSTSTATPIVVQVTMDGRVVGQAAIDDINRRTDNGGGVLRKGAVAG